MENSCWTVSEPIFIDVRAFLFLFQTTPEWWVDWTQHDDDSMGRLESLEDKFEGGD